MLGKRHGAAFSKNAFFSHKTVTNQCDLWWKGSFRSQTRPALHPDAFTVSVFLSWPIEQSKPIEKVNRVKKFKRKNLYSDSKPSQALKRVKGRQSSEESQSNLHISLQYKLLQMCNSLTVWQWQAITWLSGTHTLFLLFPAGSVPCPHHYTPYTRNKLRRIPNVSPTSLIDPRRQTATGTEPFLFNST